MIKFKLFFYEEKQVRRKDIENYIDKQSDRNLVQTFKEILQKQNLFDKVPQKYPICQLFGKQLEKTVFCQLLGYFPYFFVKIEHLKNILSTDEQIKKFGYKLEEILKKDYKNKNKQFIHSIQIVKRYDFYGFNQSLQTFLKIELYSQSYIKKLGNMLQFGVLGGYEFKCYEIHIENEIKFYKDFNLGGFSKVSIKNGFIVVNQNKFSFKNFSFCDIEIFSIVDWLSKNRASTSKKIYQKKWLTKNLLLLWKDMFKQFPNEDFKQEKKFLNQELEEEQFNEGRNNIQTDFRKEKNNINKLKDLQKNLLEQVESQYDNNIFSICNIKVQQFKTFKQNQRQELGVNFQKKFNYYKERTKKEKVFIEKNKFKKENKDFTFSQQMLYYQDKQHYKHQYDNGLQFVKDSQTKFLKLKKPIKKGLNREEQLLLSNQPTKKIQDYVKDKQVNEIKLKVPPRIYDNSFNELKKFTVSSIYDIQYFYPEFKNLFNRQTQKIFNKRYPENAFTKKFMIDLFHQQHKKTHDVINLSDKDKLPSYYKVSQMDFYSCQNYKELQQQKYEHYQPRSYLICKNPPVQTDLDKNYKDKYEFQNNKKIDLSKDQDIKIFMKYFVVDIFSYSSTLKMPDPLNDEIIYIFIQTQNEQIILCNTKNYVNNYINYNKQIALCRNELDLLKVFVLIVLFYDPDLFIGFDIEKYSMGYIKERQKKIKQKILSYISKLVQHNYSDFFQDFRIENQDFINMNKFKEFALQFIINIPQRQNYKSSFKNNSLKGRKNLNLSRIFKENFKLKSYTLETVYHKFFDKTILNLANKTLQKFYQEKNYKQIIDYFCERIQKTKECFEKSMYIQRAIQFTKLYGISIAQIHRGSQYKIEACLIRVCNKLNYVLLSSNMLLTSKQLPLQYKAYNLEPPRSLFFEPVVVLDFQSFYPSIMISHNMCYSTLVGNVKSHVTNDREINFGFTSNNVQLDQLKLKDVLVTKNGSIFIKKKIKRGIIPQILEEFIQTRIMLKKCKKMSKNEEQFKGIDIKQQILKLFMNVMYGYTGAGFTGKMPCSDIADAVVSTARSILFQTMKRVELMDERYKVIYGDTDSLFILFRNTTVFQAELEAKKIVYRINLLLPKPIELHYEKVYYPFFINSKKKYCGIKHINKQKIFEAKGLEIIRTDTCQFVEKNFESLIKKVFEKPDLSTLTNFFQDLFENLNLKKYPLNSFIFSRKFKHKTYKNKIPSVLVVEDLQKIDRMLVPSHKHTIQYVFVKSCKEQLRNKAIEVNQFIERQDQFEIDYEYYVRKQLGSPLTRFFDGLGIPQRCLENVLQSY